MKNPLSGSCAIIGIGEVPYSRNSGLSDLALMTRVVKLAADDAGISVKDIDGIVLPSATAAGRSGSLEGILGMSPSYCGQLGMGGASPIGCLMQAVAAINAGFAHRVLCVMSRNAYSGATQQRARRQTEGDGFVTGDDAFEAVYGWLDPAPHYAVQARIHMQRFGTTERQFGEVAVATRYHASLNDHAQMRKLITLVDHQASRMIADPFRLLDCSLISDGGAAFIVASVDEARDRKARPVYVAGLGMARPAQPDQIPSRPEITQIGTKVAGARAFAMAGLTPKDVDVAELYDCFTYVVIKQIEDLSFCGEGEGGPFVEGGRIRLGGELPVNTHGGLLSQGHMVGMNHIVEGVRQLRGDAGPAQVKDAQVALISGYGDLGDATVAILNR